MKVGDWEALSIEERCRRLPKHRVCKGCATKNSDDKGAD
jgi:hypothetical protein